MSYQVNYIGPSRVADNEQLLLQDIVEILAYTCPEFTITINKKDLEIVCHIRQFPVMYKGDLVSNLLWINKNLGVKIHFSSSLAISSTISFSILLNNSSESLSLHPKFIK